MNIWIGTSGFQYPEWKGTFYPDDLPASKMLPFYSERFSSTEINYTFRRIPSSKTIDGWSKATPDRFKFSLKAPQKITHFAKLQHCSDTLLYFHQIVSALGDKLGIVLFQLPPTFAKDIGTLASFLTLLPDGLRAAFEFRHPSWFADEVFTLLRAHNAALCIADSEKLTTPVVATADFVYLRLRREDYTAPDVARWAECIRDHANRWKETFVYFKHEESGIGPKLAKQMAELVKSDAAGGTGDAQ